ncbi:uncharacterized protein LOC134457768 [Engraulis encrasicolus]|uniref:uncharacterized protein LOC134457768 n=1 Tax=Engraulis encrasicolus TaxID=184585 RepID=UPI002FD29770
MEDCLHTSSDNLCKLVKWAHSHGTICTLIPNLKHLLSEGSHGNLTALWGCGAGHAYHWPLAATCKTVAKETRCYPDDRRGSGITTGNVGVGHLRDRDRFLTSSSRGKAKSGERVAVRSSGDLCDFSNGSEPSEADETTEDYSREEYNSSLFDIVCESSATDEDGDSSDPQQQQQQQQQQHCGSLTPSSGQQQNCGALPPSGGGTQQQALRKRSPAGGALEERAASGDPAHKKIKQEGGSEDYYSLANQLAGSETAAANQLASPDGGPSPSSSSSAPRPTSSHTHTRPSSLDRDSLGASPHLQPASRPLRGSKGLTPGSSSAPPPKSELEERLPGDELLRADWSEPTAEELAKAAGAYSDHADAELTTSQTSHGQNSRAEAAGCLAEESEGPAASLQEFVATIDPDMLRGLQAVIGQILAFRAQPQPPIGSQRVKRHRRAPIGRHRPPQAPPTLGQIKEELPPEAVQEHLGQECIPGPGQPELYLDHSVPGAGPVLPELLPGHGAPGLVRQDLYPGHGVPGPGRQELFPGCGVFIPGVHLAAMLQEARQDCMRLFHQLFEHFFSEEDLLGAVAFGKRGKVPNGKKVLDRTVVDAIITYVLRCSTVDGWTSVDSSKLKKACINKCRMRMGQRRRLGQQMTFYSPENYMTADHYNTEEESPMMSDHYMPSTALEIERLRAQLAAERSKAALLGETITSLQQDKQLLQQELTKKAELICDFLQDQLRPEKRRAHSSNQMEAGSSQQPMAVYVEEGGHMESPALFDSFEDVEFLPVERQRIKISKRSREGENTRVRMKNVVGVIARYMAALQEFRRSVSMKVAFDRIGVDRNTISRTAAIAELSLAAPEVINMDLKLDERLLEDRLFEERFGFESCREQNEKTIRSTQTAIRNFRDFLTARYPSESREMFCIPPPQLDVYLASFFVSARQKDGSEYEPNSLANYQCGLERHLKENRYHYSITRDPEFRRSQEALKRKQLELKVKGKGNKPHKALKLTTSDELQLRKRGLLSRHNPEGLLNLVWLNTTRAFGHCTGFHSAALRWGDIRLTCPEAGLECLEWTYQEPGDGIRAPRRAGTECRIYATPTHPHTCPVQDYREYAQRRPQAMLHSSAPFYLSIKPVVNLAALHWFNCSALGKNKLAKMVKVMCEKGGIPGRHTNFSVYQSCSAVSEHQGGGSMQEEHHHHQHHHHLEQALSGQQHHHHHDLHDNHLSQPPPTHHDNHLGHHHHHSADDFVIADAFDPDDTM